VKGWKEHKRSCVRELPQSESFGVKNAGSLKVRSYIEEDDVVVCVATPSSATGTLASQDAKRLLKFAILVSNHSKGSAKCIAKTVLLTEKNNLTRTKVFSSASETPSFIELSGKKLAPPLDQVSLESGQSAVMVVSFQVDQEREEDVLNQCEFLEIPLKIDGKGVVKIKAQFHDDDTKKALEILMHRKSTDESKSNGVKPADKDKEKLLQKISGVD